MTRLILMAILALGCIWLVVRTAMIDSVDAGTVALVERVVPGNANVELALASAQFVGDASGLPVASPAVVQRGHDALRNKPLAAEPFLFDGAAAMKDGRTADGTRLLAEALRRDPRSRLTRMLSYQNRLQSGDFGQGFRELMDLARFEPTLIPKLAPELAKLSLIPEVRAPLHRTLRLNPAMQDAMLAELVRMRADASTILALADPIRPAAPGVRPPSWQAPFLDMLIARGDVPGAHAAWRRFAGVSAVSGLYDPGFERRPGPPPFNWFFSNVGGGVAEPASGGRLAIEYFGRAPADLARQLLVLAPGRYTLSMQVSSEEADLQTGLDVRVRCVSVRAPLAMIALPGTGGATRSTQLAFDVPEGCAGQWLMLVGTPRDSGGSSHATIGGLRLKAGGAS